MEIARRAVIANVDGISSSKGSGSGQPCQSLLAASFNLVFIAADSITHQRVAPYSRSAVLRATMLVVLKAACRLTLTITISMIRTAVAAAVLPLLL